MRLRCFYCGKPVTNEIPDDTIFRATATCPECEEADKELEPVKKDAREILSMLQRYVDHCGDADCTDCNAAMTWREKYGEDK